MRYNKVYYTGTILNISFISEPFLESVPQIHILLILWLLESEITFFLNPGLFIFTFTSSALTATLGMAKFLKTGPCRLVPDEGPLGGHGTLSFLILMLNIALTIVSKGAILPAIGIGIKDYLNPGLYDAAPLFDDPVMCVIVWIAICYLPQLIYVSIFYAKVNIAVVSVYSTFFFSECSDLNNKYWTKKVNQNDHTLSSVSPNSSFFLLDIWRSKWLLQKKC